MKIICPPALDLFLPVIVGIAKEKSVWKYP